MAKSKYLTAAEEMSYGRFEKVAPEQAILERFFFLDDADLELVAKRRGDRNRLGFSLQLVTARHLGTFLEDPLDVPSAVVEHVAGQVGVAEPSCVNGYLDRRATRFEHQAEIAEVYGYVSYASAEAEMINWLDGQAWTTGDQPKPLFYAAVGWLRARRVLLPGVTTLRDEVASVRKKAEARLHAALAGAVTGGQTCELEKLLRVQESSRWSQLEMWRKAGKNTTGRGMVMALNRVSEIAGLRLGEADVDGVPKRRLIALAKEGRNETATKLDRLPYEKKIATLLATVRWLEISATDDALELFDAFMSNELIGRAHKVAEKAAIKRAPVIARHARVLQSVVELLLEAEDASESMPLGLVWEMIEAQVGSRAQIAAAVAGIREIIPPPQAEPEGQWREAVVERYATVRGFAKILCGVVGFTATADAHKILAAMQELSTLLDLRETVNVPKGYLDARKVDLSVVPRGWWQKLVFPTDRPKETVDRNAYVFCVLEQFHTALKHRDIFAAASDRWSDPRARLLSGPAWENAKGPALGALLLPEQPDSLLAELAATLDMAWRTTADGITASGDLTTDADGRIHLGKDDALEDTPTLQDLRTRVAGMIPYVDLSELVLEVMGWHPDFTASFTSAAGATSRLADLHVSVAALLTAHALNIGLGPVISDAPALTRDRLSHVDQHYLGSDSFAAANTVLIKAQRANELAQAWGGGLVAAVDGMRFIVPVRSVDARPNPKYFHRKKGVTWLNMISDQSVGLAGKVVSGTPKDTLHFVDLLYNPDDSQRPEVLVTDQGSYSDIVFGLVTLLGFDYRPVLADLPDAKLWRINRSADYGRLDKTARGKIDAEKIRRHWPDICRIAASIHTREVSAHDVIRILQRDGRPTDLGEAVAHYGRIFKTLHVLTFVDDPAYRREMKAMRNLQEGRHALGRHIFHGREGKLHQAYREGAIHLGAPGHGWRTPIRNMLWW